MKHIVIGTAGHIDHGKTTLIEQLTGTNTDRLIEEKKRGITIELGFAHFDLPSGNQVGIVDVPGHEKFIRQMVAGVVGMDMVLFIVAADEGVMPQTREHMDILSQLGIQKSIIVITKCDLVDQEWLELIQEEVQREVVGTFLEAAPIIPVSAREKQTLEQLIVTIDRMTQEELVERNCATLVRLPVDRVFTLQGIGTIVTGTLISGQIQQDMELQLYPSSLCCKVKGLQVYGQAQPHCDAGQRVALQLSNCKKEDIQRGDVLAPPGSMYSTELMDTKIQLLPHSKRSLTQRSRIHFHIGTSEVIGRVKLLEQEILQAGESGFVQIRLEQPVAVQRGDRFVIRFYSPMETIGGGVVLDPRAVKHKYQQSQVIAQLQQLEEGTPEDALVLVLRQFGETMCVSKELARRMGQSLEEVESLLEKLQIQGLVCLYQTPQAKYVWHIEDQMQTVATIRKTLQAFHQAHPYAIGMNKSDLVLQVRKKIPSPLFEQFLTQCFATKILKQQQSYISLLEFAVQKDALYLQLQQQLCQRLQEANTTWLTQEEIYENQENCVYLADIMQTLEEEGIITKLMEESDKRYYTLSRIVTIHISWMIQVLQDQGVMTLVEVKEQLQSSRKNAKILLEYSDRNRITAKDSGESQRILGKDWNEYLTNSRQ